MRIRNKEIRKRRHRKEQVIKAARRALRELYGDKPKAAAAAAPEKAKAKKAAAEKAEPKKTAKRAAAPAEGAEEAPKPKAKRASKKAEEAPAE